MEAYYNEHDPQAAAWLRELIRCGHIAEGEVDERSILDVRPDDLRGFRQCHFFAGIGGWSYALRLAGWPDERPVWTGSPPCQPFSAAGKQAGRDDARHLGPHFVGLVRACRPGMLFGEQVASAAVFGKAAKRAGGAADGAPAWAWLDDLCDRLEAAHYAVGASDLPAAGVGAPHIRQRTFFGAVRLDHPSSIGRVGWRPVEAGGRATLAAVERSGDDGRLADADGERCDRIDPLLWRHQIGRDAGNLPEAAGRSESVRLGNPDQPGLEGRRPAGGADQWPAGAHGLADRPGQDHNFWADADWLFCRDGKWRPVEPGSFPLAYGLPARVGRLRGYGNAIVPQAAAQFVIAFDAACRDLAA